MSTSAQLAGALRRSLNAVARPRVKTRDELARLAEQQAALRRVATLVAGGASSTEVFASVAEEVAQVMHMPMVAVLRSDDDGEAMTIIAARSERPHPFQPGTRWPLDGQSMSARVLRTGRPARVETYTGLPGALADGARAAGLDSAAGAPIMVDGRIWGVIATASTEARLSDDVEDRLAEFTELMATAIANGQAHDDLHQLVEEQAALRRVATLVALGASPAELFEAVIGEVGRLVPADAAALSRYEAEDGLTMIGSWSGTGGYVPVGERHALGSGTLGSLVGETHRPGRIDSYTEASGSLAGAVRDLGWRSSVGAPIMVEGRLWGVIAVASTTDRSLPLDTEQRVAQFTELLATAIANAENREELSRLADEQAALRRVATLVARGAPPPEVFEAVIGEVGRLLGADGAALSRFDSDAEATMVSSWSKNGPVLPARAGMRFTFARGTAAWLVFNSSRPARVNCYDGVPGEGPASARDRGWRSSVAAPVIVDGRLWGLAIVLSKDSAPLPPDTEARLGQFTELLATAIANAEGRAELAASRARIVATADATRRRIERDLHDGAQQRLVSLALEVRAAQAAAPPELGDHHADLSHVVEGLTGVLDELRETALGIHPAVLAEGGLGPALKTLARRSPIPVELDLQTEGRLPEPVEVAAYYVVSEALTNAAKYAHATVVHVEVETRDHVLGVSVHDDGLGGADPARGSGLLGLKDRAEAIGGTITLESPPGGGTSLRVELPLNGHAE